jgi:hypothetical protein
MLDEARAVGSLGCGSEFDHRSTGSGSSVLDSDTASHIALEVGDIEEAPASDVSSGSDSAVKVTQWPSSILATNSSLYKKGAGKPRMTVAILVWSSTIKTRHDARLRMRASRHQMAPFSISATHGSTVSRSSDMTIHQGQKCPTRHGSRATNEERKSQARAGYRKKGWLDYIEVPWADAAKGGAVFPSSYLIASKPK